jgi:hypothetical protein
MPTTISMPILTGDQRALADKLAPNPIFDPALKVWAAPKLEDLATIAALTTASQAAPKLAAIIAEYSAFTERGAAIIDGLILEHSKLGSEAPQRLVRGEAPSDPSWPSKGSRTNDSIAVASYVNRREAAILELIELGIVCRFLMAAAKRRCLGV